MDEADLVERIYEASVLPEFWPHVLDQAVRTANGRAGLLSTVRANKIKAIFTSDDFSETWQLIFRRFPGASNERTQRLLANRAAGFVIDSDVFSMSELNSDPLYTEILLPRGYGSGVATCIQFPGGDAAVINIERSAAVGPFQSYEVGRLDRLRPHLARSAMLSARLAFERSRTAVETLAALGYAACAVTQTGRVIMANEAFDADRSFWTTVSFDRLLLRDERAAKLLHNALASETPGHRVRSLALRADDHSLPAVLHVIPVRRAAHDLFRSAEAILVLSKPSADPTSATPLLQTLFDLTRVEADLAARVVAGQSLDMIARLDKKSIETVRNQLKSVLSKTGCRRQVDLARLLTQLVPSVRL